MLNVWWRFFVCLRECKMFFEKRENKILNEKKMYELVEKVWYYDVVFYY